MKNSYIQKFTSRKFIISAISALCGLFSLIFGENEVVSTLSSALMVIVPTVVYCIIEGKIDAASAAAVGGAVKDVAKQLGAGEKTVDAIDKLHDFADVLLTDDE